MENTSQEWQRDWKAFVYDVARLVNSGCDEKALTEYFQKKPICWSGTVYEKFLEDNDELPGVQVTMPMVQVALTGDRRLRGGFLYAPFLPGQAELWHFIEKGAVVHFETELNPGRYPFYGVTLDDVGQGVFTVAPRLRGAKPLSLDEKLVC